VHTIGGLVEAVIIPRATDSYLIYRTYIFVEIICKSVHRLGTNADYWSNNARLLRTGLNIIYLGGTSVRAILLASSHPSESWTGTRTRRVEIQIRKVCCQRRTNAYVVSFHRHSRESNSRPWESRYGVYRRIPFTSTTGGSRLGSLFVGSRKKVLRGEKVCKGLIFSCHAPGYFDKPFWIDRGFFTSSFISRLRMLASSLHKLLEHKQSES
jgi:hypothetical protein